MAALEKRGGWYRLIFKYAGRRVTHSLHTADEKTALALKGGVERTILQLGQRLLQVPAGADLKEFVLSGGQVLVPLPRAAEPEIRETAKTFTLADLKKRYTETLAFGAVEANSLETVGMHLRHFVRSLGANFQIQGLTQADLQGRIVQRSKQRGIRKRPLTRIIHTRPRKGPSQSSPCRARSVHSRARSRRIRGSPAEALLTRIGPR